MKRRNSIVNSRILYLKKLILAIRTSPVVVANWALDMFADMSGRVHGQETTELHLFARATTPPPPLPPSHLSAWTTMLWVGARWRGRGVDTTIIERKRACLGRGGGGRFERIWGVFGVSCLMWPTGLDGPNSAPCIDCLCGLLDSPNKWTRYGKHRWRFFFVLVSPGY